MPGRLGSTASEGGDEGACVKAATSASSAEESGTHSIGKW